MASLVDPLVLVSDGQHRITRLNEAGTRLTGYREDEVLGELWYDVFLPCEERTEVLEELSRMLSGAEDVPLRRRSEWRKSDGSPLLLDWGKGVLLSPGGELAEIVITGLPIDAATGALIGSFEWDVVENTLSWSDDLYRIYGLEPQSEPLTYESFLARVHPSDRVTVVETVSGAVAAGHAFRMQERIIRPDGEVRHLSTWAEVLTDRNGAALLVIGSCQDVTESRRADDTRREFDRATREIEEQIAHAATHDSVTGLPNRVLLHDRLEQAVARGRRRLDQLGVLLFDLDRFRLVNEVLGQEAGDEVLRAVGERLRVAVRPEDTVARIGTDEFVVVSERHAGDRDFRSLAERLLDVICAPLSIGGRELVFTASAGIAICERDESSATSLLRDATAAMRRAQEQGGGRLQVFARGMGAQALIWLDAEQNLRRGLAAGGLRLLYQPVVRLGDGRIVGFEALARLEVSGRGLVPPAEFIPLAERTGLIRRIGRHVIAQACRDAAEFATVSPGFQPQIAINLSARELAQPDIVDDIAAALAASGLSPEHLCIEVTETSLMARPRENVATLGWLHHAGVALALDDFGTGYSSLAYLRHLPVDLLKIDRSFIAGLGTADADETTVDAIVSLAHALGVEVVAEGVETAEQLAIVTRLGADYAQGFFLSRPVESSQVPALLNGSRSAP